MVKPYSYHGEAIGLPVVGVTRKWSYLGLQDWTGTLVHSFFASDSAERHGRIDIVHSGAVRASTPKRDRASFKGSTRPPLKKVHGALLIGLCTFMTPQNLPKPCILTNLGYLWV